jgi:uncharacterized protein (TIRG00374 family)
MLRRILLILLQVVVTTAAILYVFHDPGKRAEIGGALRRADKTWIALGCVCYACVEIAATVRWHLLLGIQRISLGWFRTGAIVIIGLFFNVFLPGLVGGDVVRLYYIFRLAPRKKLPGSLSIVMDRLLGLLAIVFLSAIVLVVRFNWLTQVPETAQLAYFALALLGGGFLCVALLFTMARPDLVRKFPRRIPFRNSMDKFGQALGAYRKHYVSTGIAFAITIISQMAYYTSYYCAGASLHQSSARTPSLLDILSIMPLVNTFTAVPISFGGVGIRETLFQRLLGHLSGVPESIAVLTASLGFTIQALCGLLGGAIYLFWRPRRA